MNLELDLRDPHADDRIRKRAGELQAEFPSADGIRAVASEPPASTPLGEALARKLALSRALLHEIGRPFHVSVVFAMYREHTRILTSDEHPHGEDFLVRKVRQLEWLFGGVEGATWDLVAVDDGCPDGSGRLARDIARKRLPDAPVRVLHLQEAIDRDRAKPLELATTADSQKGGSILYGMLDAVSSTRDNHVVLFTDADLSTHLGQAGLLAHPLLTGDAEAAVGSRRLPESVVVKTGLRNDRGKLFIYLWKRLLEPLRFITDTQCGFKAFSADAVREIVPRTSERRFAFDIELLLLLQRSRPGSIRRVPIAWIDSEAASTTADLQPYLPMLRSITDMYRRLLPASGEADAFASFVEHLDETAWRRLVERVPEAITTSDPTRFGEWNAVSVSDMESIARTG